MESESVRNGGIGFKRKAKVRKRDDKRITKSKPTIMTEGQSDSKAGNRQRRRRDSMTQEERAGERKGRG